MRMSTKAVRINVIQGIICVLLDRVALITTMIYRVIVSVPITKENTVIFIVSTKAE